MVFGDTPLLLKVFGVLCLLGFGAMSLLPTAFWVYRVAWAAFIVFVAYACAFHTDRLTLDFASRTYLRERGRYPWLRREGGSFGDFERLHVSPGTIRTRYAISPVWKVWLVREQGTQSPGEQSDCLSLGELHGTQEIPRLLAGVLDDLAALGYGALALEIPSEAMGGPLAGDAVPPFFLQPASDGRGNEQVLALLREVAERGWEILCFDANSDQTRSSWQERDRTMAENLAAQWAQRCPERKVIGVCGNLHSRLKPLPEIFAHLWPSFAACFAESNPQRVVHSVVVEFHRGSFFNNGGVQELGGKPIDQARWGEDTHRGHSWALHLPEAKPATFLVPPTLPL